MTIKEVLQEDVKKLMGIMLPVSAETAWMEIRDVVHNLNACVEAIEKSQAEQENEQKPEAEEQTEEN